MTFTRYSLHKPGTFGCLFLAAMLACASVPATAQTITGPRADEPIVRTGAQIPHLEGQLPGRLVAFRYEGGWVQIPLQVDQRKDVDVGTVRNDAPVGLTVTSYADPGTLVGPDPDPTFDADDELVFMAGEAGSKAPDAAARPSGVLPLPSPAIEAALTDPDTGQGAYVYLFVSDGSLDPAAGGEGVSYRYNLLSGTYPSAYDFSQGPNPEDSTVLTPYYSLHFSDRWVRDGLSITAGTSSGVNILDHHKFVFYPGNCGRTEVTFSEGGGGFFANIDGPVRAIRSYLGANSGYATQRDHFFYPRRHEIITYCRVHPIPGALDYMDYSSGALGMHYADEKNPAGCTIDGIQDSLSSSMPLWEMVTGPQGTLTIVRGGQIDVGGVYQLQHYYNDQTVPQYTQCTGDSHEYGASGPWIVGAIWNTDPLLGSAGKLVLTQVEYYDPPGQGIATAQARAEEEVRPLGIQTSSWPVAAVPSITSVASAKNPFRLKVVGEGFKQGCSVRIGASPAPETAFKNQSLAVAKGGAKLKGMLPRGTAVAVTVVNADGESSPPWSFTRP